MDPDQLARDRHVEVLASITELRKEISDTRLEVKSDLLASRKEYLENLNAHNRDDAAAFEEIRKDIQALKNWKSRTAALGTIGVLLLTTVTAFLSSALAAGKL